MGGRCCIMPSKHKPVPDLELAAAVLVDAARYDDATAAAMHNLSRRTVLRHRKRMRTDPLLAQLVADKLKELEHPSTHLPTVQEALEQALWFVFQAARNGNYHDPEMVKAIADAYGIIADIDLAREGMRQYLALLQANRQPTQTPQAIAQPARA